MEKERKIAAPEGCEIEKVEIVDGVAVVTFKQKERKLPKMKLFYSKSKIIKGMLFKKYYNEESGHKCVYLRPWYNVDLSFFPFTFGLGFVITWRSDVKSFSLRLMWILFEIERTIQCERVI